MRPIRLSRSFLSLACALGALPLVAGVAPADVDAALTEVRGDVVVWLDARSLANLADGEPIAEWRDVRSPVTAAIQPIPERRPMLVAQATNGLPAARFDAGTRQALIVPDVPLAADSTQFYVFSPRGFGRNDVFFEHGPNVNAAPGSLLYGDVPMFTIRRGGTLASVAGQSKWVYLGPGHSDLDLMVPGNGIWVVVSAVHRSGDERDPLIVRRNGTQQNAPYGNSTRIANDVVVDQFHIGYRDEGSFWSDMELGEIILVNRPLSDAAIAEVERALARKWGVDLNE